MSSIKSFFRLINEFNESANSKPGSESVSKLLKGLKEYIVFHFKTEEMYLRLSNYPNFDLHKKEHEKFIEKVLDIEQKYLNGVLPDSSKIVAFFTAWITYHVKNQMEHLPVIFQI
ncbi:MAG: hemerythrin family protein [Chloroflexia bacterium]|nr:hemerythrin family protein [Chloroflexia bacterium]